MNEIVVKLKIPTEQAMLAFGKQLALAAGDTAVIFLYGQLGAGKTTFTRGFLQGLGYAGHVKSPTYTLVEPYQLSNTAIYHFDFYRLRDPHELDYMGIQDYFVPRAICIVEWPEYGADMLPRPDLSCYIEQASSGRNVKLVPSSECGETILHRFERNE
jgi:tRNA threonylcarbamoyladenosine biosynthesis protein TsaE